MKKKKGVKGMSTSVFDGKVTLKIKGEQMRVWELPTERELHAITEFVADAIGRGIKVEHFEIQRSLNIL